MTMIYETVNAMFAVLVFPFRLLLLVLYTIYNEFRDFNHKERNEEILNPSYK